MIKLVEFLIWKAEKHIFRVQLTKNKLGFSQCRQVHSTGLSTHFVLYSVQNYVSYQSYKNTKTMFIKLV